MKMIKTKKEISFAVIWVIALVLLDQITKLLASVFLQGKPDLVLIPGVFVLRYLRNDSAAFSLDPVTTKLIWLQKKKMSHWWTLHFLFLWRKLPFPFAITGRKKIK